VDFIVPDFNASSIVTANVYFNGALKTTQTFDWDNTGTNYLGISGRSVVPGTVVDNLNIQTGVTQAPAITVTQTNGGTNVKEGDYSDQLILSVNSDPLGYPLTIDITDSLDPNQVTVTPSQVVITTANWQSPQIIITIAAIDDADMERETHQTQLQFTITTSSTSPYYDYPLSNLTVDIHDNDCGTMGFNRADFNLDCQVALDDLVYFAQDWILAGISDPECDNCALSGFNLVDFDMNCQFSMDDFSAFAAQWNVCSFPTSGCQDYRF